MEIKNRETNLDIYDELFSINMGIKDGMRKGAEQEELHPKQAIKTLRGTIQSAIIKLMDVEDKLIKMQQPPGEVEKTDDRSLGL